METNENVKVKTMLLSLPGPGELEIITTAYEVSFFFLNYHVSVACAKY